MTQTSCNYAGRYFRYVFVKLRACFVFSVLFAAFCIPPTCLMYSENDAATEAIFGALAFISAGGLLAVAFVTPMVAMKHLYTKTEADNCLSLPLTAGQRYFGELGAILLCSAAPFGVISFPCCAILHAPYLTLAVHGLLAITMLTVFDVFLMTLCGRRTEAILYPIALNILIPLVVWFGMHLGLMNIFGCGDYNFAYFPTFSSMRLFRIGLMIMSGLSPVGNFIGIIAYEGEWYLAVFASLVFIAVMIPLGLLTYSKRRAENIGRSFVYKPVYTITSVFVAVSAVVCFFWAAENNLRKGDGKDGFFHLIPSALPVLAIGLFLLLLLMEAVNYKRIKSVPKFLLKYVGVFAAGTLVSLALYESDGFGESAYIPSAAETSYVWISTEEYAEEFALTSMEVAAKGDGEIAALIRGAHKELTEDRENAMKYTDYAYGRGDGASVSFTYYLKDGSMIYRSYDTDVPEGLRTAIVESEEYRYSDLLMTDIELGYLHTLGTAETYQKRDEIEPIAVQLSNPVMRAGNRLGNRRDCITIDGILYPELREALETDLRNAADYGQEKAIPIGILEIGSIDGGPEDPMFISRFWTMEYPIYDSYTNTLALLGRYADLPTSADAAEDIGNAYRYYTLIKVPYAPFGQDIVSHSRYTFGFGENETNEALLTKEQFLEALSYSARYVRGDPERGYYYAILVGAPNAMRGTALTSELHSELYGKPVMISGEFYDTLDEWYEAGYLPPLPEDETSLSVDYACHAR